MKVVVTGGAGFIGSAVCRLFAGKRGFSVLNLDKLTYAANLASLKPVEKLPNYGLKRCDICDRLAVDAALAEFKPDAIVHLAAESHVDRSITGAGTFIQTNIVGTFTLLEATRHYWSSLSKRKKEAFRFLHVSTDEVYGSLGHEGLFTEETAYDPSSPYSSSKAASDHLVTAWQRTYGLPTLISNCSNNYGPYQFPEKLIPLMIINALEGRPLPIYGKGENIRDWLYVDDHADAIATILARGRIGEKYNVGGRNERTNLAVVEAVCNLLDKHERFGAPHRRLITHVEDRPGHDLRYAIDANKLETELGWRARETFETGIEKTVAWYLANSDWWKPIRGDVYSGERLGVLKKTKNKTQTELVPA